MDFKHYLVGINRQPESWCGIDYRTLMADGKSFTDDITKTTCMKCLDAIEALANEAAIAAVRYKRGKIKFVGGSVDGQWLRVEAGVQSWVIPVYERIGIISFAAEKPSPSDVIEVERYSRGTRKCDGETWQVMVFDR